MRGALGRVPVRGPHVNVQILEVVALTLGYAIEFTGLPGQAIKASHQLGI